MRINLEKELDERDLRYKNCDFFYHPVIGKEVVRYKWKNPKNKGHYMTHLGITYFDDFVMGELQYLAEKNSGGFKL